MSNNPEIGLGKKGPKCLECPLYEPGIRVYDLLPVGVGLPDSSYCGLTLIGEMPGAEEVKHTFPFSGRSGRLLWSICESVGVPKDEVHVTNAILCGLPRGEKPNKADGNKALECCRPYVLDNLHKMGTKVVCVLGAVALKSFAGLEGINKYRGTVMPPIEEEPWIITSTLHPAGLLQNEATRILTENVRFDIKKAYDLARGDLDLWDPIVEDAGDAKALIEFLSNIATDDYVAIDVETTGVDPFACDLVTIGIATAPYKTDGPVAWAIPWAPAFPGFYTDDEWDEILNLIIDIVTTETQKTIFHNFTFDLPVLERHLKVEITSEVHDTLLLDHAAYPKLPHNLQNLASRYLPVEAWKTDFRASEKAIDTAIDKEIKQLDTTLGMSEAADEEEDLYKGAVHVEQLDEQAVSELLHYNASDAAATWKIFWPLLQEAKELDTYKVYQSDIKLAAIALHWTEDGIGIDLEERAKLDIEYSKDLKKMKAELRALSKLPDSEGINKEIGYWVDLLDSVKKEAKSARKVCTICAKECASGPALKKHIEKEHAGHEAVSYNAEWLEACLADAREARVQIKRLRSIVTKDNFNPASPPQLRKVLLNRGLTPLKVTKKTLEASTAKDSLWELREDEFVDLLFRWRSKAKLHSTYVKNLVAKLGPDMRLHPNWKIVATPSGRFGTAPAVQNWPKSMKRLMVACPETKIVGADYNALELRVIALLAGQQDLIDAFVTGANVHAKHAGLFFPTVWPDIQAKWIAAADTNEERDRLVPEYNQLRNAGKPVTFGSNYGAQGRTLYENIREKRPDVKTPQEHKRLLAEVTEMSKILAATYPNIVDWRDAVTKEANENFCLRTALSGRIRKWPMGDASLTECSNHPVQGLAADIMNAATLRLVARLKEEGIYRNGAWIILQIHDALYLEVATEFAEKVAKILEESMETTLTLVSVVTGQHHTMRFPAEAKICNNVAKI